MRRIRTTQRRLRSLFRRSREEEELARELDLHLKQLAKQLIRRVSRLEDIFCDIVFAWRVALGAARTPQSFSYLMQSVCHPYQWSARRTHLDPY